MVFRKLNTRAILIWEGKRQAKSYYREFHFMALSTVCRLKIYQRSARIVHDNVILRVWICHKAHLSTLFLPGIEWLSIFFSFVTGKNQWCNILSVEESGTYASHQTEAGTESVSDPQLHSPNRFPFEKVFIKLIRISVSPNTRPQQFPFTV